MNEFINDSIFCTIMITNIRYDQYALLNLGALQSSGLDALLLVATRVKVIYVFPSFKYVWDVLRF